MRRTLVVCLLALSAGPLWLTGCGSGGGPAPQGSADATANARGVPVTVQLDTTARSVLLDPRGTDDDFVAILASLQEPGSDVRVNVNGGAALLPQLTRSRAASSSRHTPQSSLPEPLGFGLGSRQAVGSERAFAFLGGSQVTATVRYAGAHCLLYLDNATPANALADADLADLGGQFDTAIFPTDTGLFGAPSDVDGNGKVILLLTPQVAPPRFGFFYSGDVLAGSTNHADLVYCRVPDPTTGDDYAHVRTGLLATLAHELQHLISFNQKALLQGRSAGEESWLNEGISFNAEQLNGYLDSLGGSPENLMFYFRSPELYTLRELSGAYQDGHAGAGYLFVRYLADRFGEAVLGRLDSGANVGRTNVAAATGQPFEQLFLDWAAALYLAGTGLNANPKYAIPGFDTRTSYHAVELTLNGPTTTDVASNSGVPSVAVELARGGLRFVRFRGVPGAGTRVQLTATADGLVRAIVIRTPRSVNP